MSGAHETINPTQRRPQGVHLVGSIPLDNAAEVFRTTSSILGERLRRIPDGETGERTYWIKWQGRFMSDNPHLEAITPPASKTYVKPPRFKLRSPASKESLTFATLGYADVAKASYNIFSQLKQQGLLPANTRFQVCLPTPLAPVTFLIIPEDQAAVEPAYQAALFAELDQIAATIPHHELAIQWDVAMEFAILAGVMQTYLNSAKAHEKIFQQLIQIGQRVPADIEMGYHLCYGDSGHRHFKEPEDTAELVSFANAISTGVDRDINWMHLPVPRNRTDDAYFAPLRTLQLHPETELYLGLVHLTDGIAGTLQRIATAQRTIATFGVATECGWGRRDPQTITDLLHIHSQVSAPVDQ